MTSTTHFAARAGRWSARHRRIAIAGWLAFVVAAVVLGGSAGFKDRTGNDGVGESGRADQALTQAFPDQGDRETVLVQHRSLTTASPAFRDTVADVVRRLRAESSVEQVQRGAVSRDRHSALVTFRFRGDVEPSLDATAAAARAHAGFRVG